MFRLRGEHEADVNITSLIDCLMNVIIFFMVVMAAQYLFGVSVKFPGPGGKPGPQEHRISVYVSSDDIDTGHTLRQPGIVRINDEEIPLVTSDDRADWPRQQAEAWAYLEARMGDMLAHGYRRDNLTVQGDMRTYHGKVMQVVDIGKALGMETFSLGRPPR
jgi:biopolymer transport protein ExbD